MKSSIKGLFVIFAVVMSFVTVQAVQAVELSGTVVDPDDYPLYTVSHAEILLDLGEEELVIVSSLGPKSYWKSLEIAYPKVGDKVTIDAYEGQTKYVAIEVCYDDGPCVQLRDYETLIPLWIAFQTTDTTVLLSDTENGSNCWCICTDDLQDCHCFCGEVPFSGNPNQ